MDMKRFGKMFLVWILLTTILLFAFASFDFTTEMNDTTVQYETNYEGNTTEDGDTAEHHKVTETTSEEALQGKYFPISMGIAAILTILLFVILDQNRAQRLKAAVPSLQADVEALSERRSHQLDQANRVVERYLVHESGILVSVAQSKVRSALDFEAMVEQYPQLSGNAAVLKLLDQIKEVEVSLVSEKQALNGTIASYNGLIHSFPLTLLRRIAKLEDIHVPASAATAPEAAVRDEDLGI